MNDLANWFHYDGSLVCVPAKNGGTSFYRAAFGIGDNIIDIHVYSAACRIAEEEGRGPYTPATVAHFQHVDGAFLAVRDPCDRFLSLWRSKCLKKDPNLWYMHGWSMKKLMDVIESAPFCNAHWFPQSAYLIPKAIPVDYRKLQERLGLPNKLCNVTEHGVESCAVVKDRVLRHYASDEQLWQRAER
jgi:hypothetical protein